MADSRIRAATDSDMSEVAAVFNHFVRNSLAAYHDQPVTSAFFAALRSGAHDYPFYVLENEDGVIGFGYLRPYHLAPTFRHTALVTYFILPEHTGRGLGSQLLDRLLVDARGQGLEILLAHISSANEGSLRFHARHGFETCGCFRRVGRKWGNVFDVVWVQRFLVPQD